MIRFLILDNSNDICRHLLSSAISLYSAILIIAGKLCTKLVHMVIKAHPVMRDGNHIDGRHALTMRLDGT